ncbi:hypothetical protein KC19_2G183500 [Ceratodon purpureus]|uniref:Uncharacterized protein n=1 Tax=Ceratodon purpureus TaxID=3225 RepID=A0A8T0IVD1_CERPU|nr:hypothetical protein KC19_2G183500 [Ceratodon purpureus]
MLLLLFVFAFLDSQACSIVYGSWVYVVCLTYSNFGSEQRISRVWSVGSL